MRKETLGRAVSIVVRHFSAALRQGESKMLDLRGRLKIWYFLPILTLVVLTVSSTPTFAQTSYPPLAFPFSAGHEWKIAELGGYDNSSRDGLHSGYAKYALDVHRKDGATGGALVLAPTDAFYIRLQGNQVNGPKCMDLAISQVSDQDWLYLEICHVDFESYLTNGHSVVKGQVLGTVATDGCGGFCILPHIHIAAHISPKNNPWSGGPRDPVPFVPEYNLALDGNPFYPDGSANQYGGWCCYQSSQAPACVLPSTATRSAHVARAFVSTSDICQSGGGDTIPPETSASLSGTVGNNGWHVSPVSGVLGASDNEGVANTYYQIDGGAVNEGTSFTLTADAIYNVCFWSVDVNGNTEAARCVQIMIDQTPPVTTGTAAGSRDMLGIFRSPVDNTLSATDNLSGVEKTETSFDGGSVWNPVSGMFTLSNNGVYEYLFRSVDVAGNVEQSKSSGTIDIARFVFLADALLAADRAVTLQVQGVSHTNLDASFIDNTTVYLETLEYLGQFSQSGNVSFTIDNLIQTTDGVQMPLYPLSFYRDLCTFIQGPITVSSVSPVYNECWYVDDDVTLRMTGATGNLTIVSEGVIYDRSTNSQLSAWDTTNGVLFWARRGYSTVSTGAVYNGVVYAPFASISGGFTNATLNGGQFAESLSLGSGTTLNAQQAAGFPPTVHTLPLVTPGQTFPNLLFVSSTTSGTCSGVTFADEDVLVVNREEDTCAMYIDGSDIGLANTDIDAFAQLSDGSILLSFDASISITGLGTVYDADIVKFTPTSLGSNTAGSFSWYFDGSDVGLTTSDEDVDAIGFTPDGKLVVSTLGSFSVSGVTGNDEDLIVFTATQLGATTTGVWAMYFDGSDVSLNESSYEDVNGVWIDPNNGKIFLTTVGSFSVSGAAGDGADVFVCTPGSLGPNTLCTYGPGLYWDGSKNGFAGEDLDAFEIQK